MTLLPPPSKATDKLGLWQAADVLRHVRSGGLAAIGHIGSRVTPNNKGRFIC
jgi:hypothetical protein